MTSTSQALLKNSESFIRFVEKRFTDQPPETFAFDTNSDLRQISAVLLLIGRGEQGEPILILNKRSKYVRQAGDLCCPGGGIIPWMDTFFARGMKLPGLPLRRWPHVRRWQRRRHPDYRWLSLLLATALREGFEEMRLNPFGITFLGPMSKQQLIMFKRVIYPMVGWVHRQRRFFPNWEVEKIVNIPMAALVETENYARFRYSFNSPQNGMSNLPVRDMPCFVFPQKGQTELLWGVTYRIIADFLEKTLGFIPPAMEQLPVVHRRFDSDYIEGVPQHR